mmetsp:Transcript_2246/g.2342  ORF Transcript_2246/g.2342 Transcript_2246/m.2342 type:complete len:128 (+) Transcript_2246:129-512(+)
MDGNFLPVHKSPVDHLRYGFRSLETERGQSCHPVANLQRANGNDWDLKLDMVRRTYGTHMAMRLMTEKEMFSRPHRLPGLQSSTTSVETLMGSDSVIGFSDVLSDPLMKPEIRKVQLHDIMEMKLSL